MELTTTCPYCKKDVDTNHMCNENGFICDKCDKHKWIWEDSWRKDRLMCLKCFEGSSFGVN